MRAETITYIACGALWFIGGSIYLEGLGVATVGWCLVFMRITWILWSIDKEITKARSK